MKILFYGLPGAGKTTLMRAMAKVLPGPTVLLDADDVRKRFDDNDFSPAGRLAAAFRMDRLMQHPNRDVLATMVCPLKEMREMFHPDTIKVWVNTITEGRYEDTNAMWETPDAVEYDYEVTVQDAEAEAKRLYREITNS